MKLTTGVVLAVAGFASLVSAIPIRIVTIEAFSPNADSNINIGDIKHIPNLPRPASLDIGKGIGGFSSSWWKEFADTYSIGSTGSEGSQPLPHPHGGHHKWHAAHPHLGKHDHSIPATDASLIPSWMYDTPLSSSRYTPVVARPGNEVVGHAMKGHGGLLKLVTGEDGVVKYQFVPAEEVAGRTHGGIGCVFGSFKRMVQSLSPHELFIFTFTTLLMLLVILRLALLSYLLIRRAHSYANEYPGAAAAERREEAARGVKVDGEEDPVPAYSADVVDVDEKQGFLPAYSERA